MTFTVEMALPVFAPLSSVSNRPKVNSLSGVIEPPLTVAEILASSSTELVLAPFDSAIALVAGDMPKAKTMANATFASIIAKRGLLK